MCSTLAWRRTEAGRVTGPSPSTLPMEKREPVFAVHTRARNLSSHPRPEKCTLRRKGRGYVVRYSCLTDSDNPNFHHAKRKQSTWVAPGYTVPYEKKRRNYAVLSFSRYFKYYLTEVLQELVRDLHQRVAAVPSCQCGEDSQHPKDSLLVGRDG